MGGSGDQTDSGGLFYNLVTDPTEPGSNGIYDDITAPEETIGGGVLTFEVSGTTTIDGNFVCLFDLIPYVPSTIFQLNRDGSSWVEPVLS